MKPAQPVGVVVRYDQGEPPTLSVRAELTSVEEAVSLINLLRKMAESAFDGVIVFCSQCEEGEDIPALPLKKVG